MDVESLEYDEAGVAVFGALADPTRRRLLELLVELRRASATRLAARLPVTRQAVIKHLHVLDTAGLVDGARAGREVLYTARVGALEASARWLADLAGSWAVERHPEGMNSAHSPDGQIVMNAPVTPISSSRYDGILPSRSGDIP
jgi:DNA-binding transcriptional ArsR family regulator